MINACCWCCRLTDCILPRSRLGGTPLTLNMSIDPTYYADNNEQLCHASLNISWEMRFHRPRTPNLEGSGNARRFAHVFAGVYLFICFYHTTLC